MMKEITIEPVTRIEGHLGIHATIDTESRRVKNAHAAGAMFRGLEIILRGREPSEAVLITQRACGVCPVPHAVASVIAVDQTYQASPPPMAVVIRNLVHGAEQLYDAEVGVINLEGPDYSEHAVKSFNPDWWDEAARTRAERSDIHGFRTIADIMRALNPMEGELYLRSLLVQKAGHNMAAIFGAKHPHVHSFVPGGVAKANLSPSDIESYLTLLMHHVAFTKELVTATDDLLDFVLAQGYDEVGKRPVNLASGGAFDDPDAYSAVYGEMTEWGRRRMVSPGMILNGELVTTDLLEINVGVREYTGSGWYSDDWEEEFKTDPAGKRISREHPWNKRTEPMPAEYGRWDDAYTWVTSPRWWNWKGDGRDHVIEVGPLARMWVTAKAGLVPASTGNSIRFELPEALVPGFKYSEAMEVEWKIPEWPNAVERVRARAYYHAYTAHCMLEMATRMLELMKAGKTGVWNEYKKPDEGIGYGVTEAMRGMVSHWCVMKHGVIHNYQYQAPTTWNASGRDADGRPGPYEEAIIDTPITEVGAPDGWKGIDIVRVVRSFDPCLGCAVHVYVGDKKKEHELLPFALPIK
ncbi:MAG TPA: hydrogenase [Candidatus Syntrophoarchaeum butanivorans]|uniref:Hydrogenase n=2 Tax=Candidatus Syntropharchaeum butanivorans TaxID=1839936 RepID=A0A1F2P5Q5_9EURY|nr:MAG: [Ni-Fe]-hydrogenase large subunit [Candidatus Syntrophoarchaeum butanivorans]RJS71884.1 MAG: hydrogenase [Candidatus Syntrophoarchaeum sp. WYZ-LMO15]HDM36691.1 hydrogenase [Candidatus Syntrophoarchaeum butanivorans]